MQINDQVCNLELAKELKQLGVKQDSILYWGVNDKMTALVSKEHLGGFVIENYSAFTLSEIIGYINKNIEDNNMNIS